MIARSLEETSRVPGVMVFISTTPETMLPPLGIANSASGNNKIQDARILTLFRCDMTIVASIFE
jgi:hypothetical protein